MLKALHHFPKPQTTKEVKTMYFRSTITGQCYKLDFIPMGTGWEAIHEDTYTAWCKEHGLEA